MKAFIIFNLNFHFHHGWDFCLSNIFYKQISRPKCIKFTKYMYREILNFYGKIPEIKNSGQSQDWKILIPLGPACGKHMAILIKICLSVLLLKSYNVCTEEACILWTVSTLYRELSLLNRELNILPPSLPYAGIHQDLGYRHLRPTKNTKIISTEPNIGVFFFTLIAHN